MRGSGKDRSPGDDGDMEEKKTDDAVTSSIHLSADRGHEAKEEEEYHDDYHHDVQQSRDERPKSPASTSVRSVASSISSLAGTSCNNNNNNHYTAHSMTMSPQNHMTKTVTRVIQDLASRQGDGPANALRNLFGLTEHVSQKDNRVALVHANDGQLVSVLLHFLEETCRENAAVDAAIMNNTSNMSDSSNQDNTSPKTTTTITNRSAEQYLSLLVLNNLCTAPENKRLIALEHDGARIISSLLFDDPSCHLLAIILVNLTFSDATLRQELIAEECEIHMVESLAFCMRVASMTSEEYEVRQVFLENNHNNDYLFSTSPLDLLRALLQEDWCLSNGELAAHRAVPGARLHETLPEKPLFPDTARYCLVALKNLTRCFGHATCISHVHHNHHSTTTTTTTTTLTDNHHATTAMATHTTIVNNSRGSSSNGATIVANNATTTTTLANPTTTRNMNVPTLTVVDNTGATTTCTNTTLSPLPLTAAQVLIRTGIVPHILRYITIADEAAANPKSKGETKNEQEASTTSDKDNQDGELEEIGLGNDANTKTVPAAAAVENTSREESTSETSQGRSSSPPVSIDPPPPATRANASGTLVTVREEHYNHISNSPSTWDANSAADAALFCILNLAAVPSAREYLREIDTVKLLTWITICGEDNKDHRQKNDTDEATKLLDFQCTKAHIALAYLIGSEGHFGQPNIRRAGMGIGSPAFPSASFSPSNGHFMTPNTQDAACLNLSAREPLLFIELLANTLHGRGKTGPGGYSPATISTKFVLYAVRCLLTQHFNQTQFALKSSGVGVKLNILLMKVLAWHVVTKTTKTVICDCPDDIDAETVEYAVFSLYLMSNHGVKSVFLPAWFGHDEVTTRSLAAKILTSYVLTQNEMSPGKHAVEQLLLRLQYLKFGESKEDVTIMENNIAGARLVESDYTFSDDLLKATAAILVAKKKPGAYPRPDIFDRPILRARVMRKSSHRSPWDNSDSVDYFPSVLVAVHELSFNSSKVRHLDAIDEFQIANNISNSANGEKTESYNHMWSWEDTATEIQRNLDRVRSSDSHVSANSSKNNNNVVVVDLSSLCVCGDLTAVV